MKCLTTLTWGTTITYIRTESAAGIQAPTAERPPGLFTSGPHPTGPGIVAHGRSQRVGILTLMPKSPKSGHHRPILTLPRNRRVELEPCESRDDYVEIDETQQEAGKDWKNGVEWRRKVHKANG